MYAIIRTGGKQYKISQGDTIRVEKLTGQAGDTVEIKDVGTTKVTVPEDADKKL